MSDDENEAVGYKRPPKQHQFQKNRSGNPRGRPRGTGLEGIVRKVWGKKLTVMVNDQRVTMTTLEAIVTRQAQEALRGNVTAARDVQATALRLDLVRKEIEEQQIPMPQLVFVARRSKPRPDE